MIIFKSFMNLIVDILTFILDLIESSSICSNFQVQEAWERSSVTPEVFWLSFVQYSCNRCTNEYATRIILDDGFSFLLAPSGALIAIPTYYCPSSTTTHFFRSHRSSTLDFLSHYSYIKAIMLYKGKSWQDSDIL